MTHVLIKCIKCSSNLSIIENDKFLQTKKYWMLRDLKSDIDINSPDYINNYADIYEEFSDWYYICCDCYRPKLSLTH